MTKEQLTLLRPYPNGSIYFWSIYNLDLNLVELPYYEGIIEKYFNNLDLKEIFLTETEAIEEIEKRENKIDRISNSISQIGLELKNSSAQIQERVLQTIK